MDGLSVGFGACIIHRHLVPRSHSNEDAIQIICNIKKALVCPSNLHLASDRSSGNSFFRLLEEEDLRFFSIWVFHIGFFRVCVNKSSGMGGVRRTVASLGFRGAGGGLDLELEIPVMSSTAFIFRIHTGFFRVCCRRSPGTASFRGPGVFRKAGSALTPGS